MWKDPIVAETRSLRDEYARQFNLITILTPCLLTL